MNPKKLHLSRIPFLGNKDNIMGGRMGDSVGSKLSEKFYEPIKFDMSKYDVELEIKFYNDLVEQVLLYKKDKEK